MSAETNDFDIDIACALALAKPDHKLAVIPAHRRKPSITTMIKRAEKSGRRVTSVTTPDGTTLAFGEGEPSDANNPWLADIGKATKQ
jgi:hypothetical protein